MVEVGGKFQLVRNEHFYEHLVALGIPEETATKADIVRPILEITIDGREVIFSTISGEISSTSRLIFDEEVDESIALDMTIKSTATIKDNQIIVYSAGPKGEIGVRIFQFFDTEMVMTLSSDNSDIPVTKRHYQRL